MPVWTAETINGWNGKSNTDAAISNFGFSSLSALERHWKEKFFNKSGKFQKYNTLQYNNKSIKTFLLFKSRLLL